MRKLISGIIAAALLLVMPAAAQVVTLPMVNNVSGQEVGSQGVVAVDSQGHDATDTANNAWRISCVSGCDGVVLGSGSLGALNATSVLSLNGAAGFSADVRGTFAGTITFQGTIDGTNWIAMTMLPAGGAVGAATVTTTTAVGAWVGNATGMQQVRMIMTAYTSGTATVTLRAVQSTGMVMAIPPLSTVASSLVAGSTLSNDVGFQYRNTATGAALAVSVLSPATPAAASIKAGAGRLIGCFLSNTAAALRSVKLYNATSVTMGTTAAAFEIDLPQNAYGTFDLPGGISFTTGQMWAVTSAKGLTDNTATGLVANDVSGVCWYQ